MTQKSNESNRVGHQEVQLRASNEENSTRNCRETNTSNIAFHVSHWCGLFFVFLLFFPLNANGNGCQCFFLLLQHLFLQQFFFISFEWTRMYLLAFYVTVSRFMFKIKGKNRFISDGNTFQLVFLFWISIKKLNIVKTAAIILKKKIKSRGFQQNFTESPGMLVWKVEIWALSVE